MSLCLSDLLCSDNVPAPTNTQDLEHELMAVIMAMETEVTDDDMAAAQFSSADPANTTTSIGSEFGAAAALVTAPLPKIPSEFLSAVEGCCLVLENAGANMEGVSEQAKPRDSPIAIGKTMPRMLRVAEPAVPPANMGVAEVAEQQVSSKHRGEAVKCPSPLSCSSESDDEMCLEDGGLFPVALEAALNAVVEEADEPWNAAVSAAVAAAQDEDSEAWHVAIEAALEVATAHAVSSQASLLASSRSPPPTRDHARVPQSPPDSENFGPEEALAPVCIPQGAVPGSDYSHDESSLQMDGNTSMTSLIDTSVIDENDLSQELLCCSLTQSPYNSNQHHAVPPHTHHATQNVLPETLASSTRDGMWTPPPGSTWVSAISSSVPHFTQEAGEAACRSIEAEIIRRCILDTSPFDTRRTRTPATMLATISSKIRQQNSSSPLRDRRTDAGSNLRARTNERDGSRSPTRSPVRSPIIRKRCVAFPFCICMCACDNDLQ